VGRTAGGPVTADRHAAVYDGCVDDFVARNGDIPAPVAAVGEELLGRLGAAPRILDLGCGPGRDMAWLEARGASVVGLDVSAGMLGAARRVVRGELVQADMRELPLPDGSFDAVWCMAALLHVPKAEAHGVLGEMRRVVRDRGLLALGVKQGDGEGWVEGPPGWDPRYFALYEVDELVALLADAGFGAGPVGANDGGRAQWLTVIATRDGPSRGATGSP